MTTLALICKDIHHPDKLIREQALTDLGRWALETCLVFGVEFETAAGAAQTFVAGIRREFVEPKEKS